MNELRFAIFGTGFWSQFQLAAWKELKGAACVAVYNRTRPKAEALAARFNVPAVYDNAEELLAKERLDFVDIITDVESHAKFVFMAAEHGVGVISQKPMAPDLKTCRKTVDFCAQEEVPFFVHENWRWQNAIRQLKRVLDSGTIGRPFRARIDMRSGFPVFKNQPFLAEAEHFIIADLGSHTLDTARFLFGEAESIYCQTGRAHAKIKGEDIATILLRMGRQTSVTVNMAYAENFLEIDRFPETFIFVEGEKGSVELAPDFWIRTTTQTGTLAKRHAPPRYGWADPAYDVVHASIVACNENLLRALQRKGTAETTGADNLRTMELVYGAYASASRNKVIKPGKGSKG